MEIAKKIETAFSLLSLKRVIINYDNNIYKPLLFRNNAILYTIDWYLKKIIEKKDLLGILISNLNILINTKVNIDDINK